MMYELTVFIHKIHSLSTLRVTTGEETRHERCIFCTVILPVQLISLPVALLSNAGNVHNMVHMDLDLCRKTL